jgi:L-ascorbate metabolism protein UlaG (beta-lactamase superfamily)
MIKLVLLLIIFSMVMGCSSIPDVTATSEPRLTNTSVVQTSPTAPTQTLASPLATETIELPSATPSHELATATTVPACVVLYYGEYAQFEIVIPSGLRIMVDINDPEKLSRPVVDRDILLTTHTHWDHFNEEFQANFPGEQLFVQTGILKAPDVEIQGIASAHNAGDQLLPDGGTNYIYIIETAGLRIAHFGDIGQTSLSKEQLKDLGKIDIAITQFHNPYSDMNAGNRKGIQLMEQLQPRLIIPTHTNLDTIKLALLQWNAYYTDSATQKVCESDFDKGDTKILLMGDVVETYRKYVDLSPWEDR